MHTDYYKQNDLAIGATVNVYGRKVVLTDCDPFTKEYYRVKYGLGKIYIYFVKYEIVLINAFCR